MNKHSREVKREPLDVEDILQETYSEFETLKDNSPLSPQKQGRIEVLAEKAQELAILVNKLIPDTKEAAVATNNLASAVMWATRGIRRQPEIIVVSEPEG